MKVEIKIRRKLLIAEVEGQNMLILPQNELFQNTAPASQVKLSGLLMESALKAWGPLSCEYPCMG